MLLYVKLVLPYARLLRYAALCKAIVIKTVYILDYDASMLHYTSYIRLRCAAFNARLQYIIMVFYVTNDRAP